jgi:hypothetical protein
MKSSSPLLQLLRRLTFRVLALATCAIAVLSAQAGDLVPFRAAWETQIELIPLAPPLVAVEGAGEGQAEHLGRMTAQSIEEVVNLGTGDGLASYRFISASGDHVYVTFAFLALPVSPSLFAVQGEWQITGGTGRFEGAEGSGLYVGEVEFVGPASGLGHFAMTGVITSPGAQK